MFIILKNFEFIKMFKKMVQWYSFLQKIESKKCKISKACQTYLFTICFASIAIQVIPAVY